MDGLELLGVRQAEGPLQLADARLEEGGDAVEQRQPVRAVRQGRDGLLRVGRDVLLELSA